MVCRGSQFPRCLLIVSHSDLPTSHDHLVSRKLTVPLSDRLPSLHCASFQTKREPQITYACFQVGRDCGAPDVPSALFLVGALLTEADTYDSGMEVPRFREDDGALCYPGPMTFISNHKMSGKGTEIQISSLEQCFGRDLHGRPTTATTLVCRVPLYGRFFHASSDR